MNETWSLACSIVPISRKLDFGESKSWQFSRIQEKAVTVLLLISKRNEIDISSLKHSNRLEISFSTTFY